MNKIFTRIAKSIAGVSLAIGAGVALSTGNKVSKVEAADDSTQYELITSTSDLEAGKSYIITNGDSGTVKAISTEANTNNRKVTSVTISNSKITRGADVMSFTLGGTQGAWTFATENYLGTAGYLASASSGKNNYLRVISTAETATISFSGNAAVINIGPHTERTLMRYNSSADIFACYITGQQPIYLWKEVAVTQTYTVSFNSNGGSGTMSAVSNVSGGYTLPSCGFTAPTGKAFVGWKAGNAGDLLAVGSSYTVSADVTFYAQWADAYTVTYAAGTNGTGSYAHTNQPAGTYTLLPFASLTGVSADTGYIFKDYTVGNTNYDPGDTITLSAATSITVNFDVKPLGSTYDFETNFDTYASGWSNSYLNHTGLDGVTDIGGDHAATIDLYKASKQTGTITTMPVIGTKTGSGSWYKAVVFTLDEVGYKIKSVSVTFAQWAAKTPDIALFKGTTSGEYVSGTPLDTGTIGTKNTISTADLNDTVFTVGYCDKNTSSNVQGGLKSITITLEALAAYGTTNHIKVTQLPETVYHVGQTYNSAGLSVTAYDGADESTANFKDVTSDVVTSLTSGVTTFTANDIPSVSMTVAYTEGAETFYATPAVTIQVFAEASYELVTSEPTDWTGKYLIVGEDSGSLYAFNSRLSDLDVVHNTVAVTADANDIITTGRQFEWSITPVTGGYSIQSTFGSYVGRTAKSNGLNVSESPLTNIISFLNGDVTIAGEVGGVAGYQLTYNTTAERFRYYSTGTVKLYKLAESAEATAYAEIFLEELSTGASAVCDAGGNTNLTTLKATWKDLADTYDILANNDKEIFRKGIASEIGTSVQQALALYDYIAAKYNTQLEQVGLDSYDFMNRNISPLSGSKLGLAVQLTNHANTIGIIVILSMASLTAIGGYFFIKRKRNQ